MSQWSPDDIEVLYRDEVMIVVNKPAGLLVHRGWGHDRVVMLSLVRKIAGCKVYPVHRLDRATSGVLLFALHPEINGTLSKQFANREVSKRYIALVSGTPPAEMMIDRPLNRKEDGPRVPSFSLVRRLYAMEYYSIAEVAPLTGRLHQVRRHLLSVNHAVIGDKRHGYRWQNRFNKEKFGLSRMALHAWSLTLTHPLSQERLSVTGGLPSTLSEPFARMGVPQRVWESLYANPCDPWVEKWPIPEETPLDEPFAPGESIVSSVQFAPKS